MSRKQLLIEHKVRGTVREVFAGFTQELFEALAPSFPPAKLERYDGNAVGDKVIIRLGVPPLTQRWVSLITEHEVTDELAYFVDEGQQLPAPLNYWRHKHLLRQTSPEEVTITEDITFGTPVGFVTTLMTPVIRAQFAARGPKYTAYFSAK